MHAGSLSNHPSRVTRASTNPLIGRAQELARLRSLVESIASGSALTVFIEGEAGIGKTRLLVSLMDEARDRGVAVFYGAAHPLERIRPFGVLVDALDLRRTSRDPRRAAIGSLLSGGDTSGAGELAAGQLQFRAIEEIIDLVEVASDQGAVLVALDDLHWADPSTLLAFRLMTRELAQVPLLLVATLRPSPRTPDLAQLLDDTLDAGAQLIHVEPMTTRDVDALVQSELGVPAGPSLAVAVERAGGNPLWVVEMLRSMSSDGALDLTGTTAELTGSETPDSLRHLVVRRLGYLPERTAATLRTASVLGDAFSLMDLATVTSRRVSELNEELAEAIKAGLLVDSDGLLAFRHQLVRDAIYEDITAAARVALHRDAGRALADAGAPMSQVASHLVLGALVGDVEAARLLRRAAGDAAPRAPAVAVELLRRSAGVLPADYPERDAVLTELVATLMRAGQVAECAALAEEILARPHDDAVDRSLRTIVLDAMSMQNRPQELIQRADDALTSSPGIPPADKAFLLSHRGFGHTFSGDLAGGEVAGREAVALAEQSGDAAMTSWCLVMLSVAVKSRGRYEEAVGLCARAVELALGSPDRAAREHGPFFMYGMALADADRLDDAAHAFRRAADECEELRVAWLLPDIRALSAEVQFLRGDWEAAQPEMETHVETAGAHGTLLVVTRMRAYLSLMAAARGDRTAASLALAPAASELTSDHPGLGAAIVGYAAAVLAESEGQPEAALAILQRFWGSDSASGDSSFHRYLAPALVRLALAHDRAPLARHVADGAEREAALPWAFRAFRVPPGAAGD